MDFGFMLACLALFAVGLLIGVTWSKKVGDNGVYQVH
jgi:hypothetical protein